jgi:predicted dehydrogenase
MTRKINWGVIGSGGIARRRTIPEGIVAGSNAQLRIVYDVVSAANEEVAGEFGVPAARDLDELLNSDVDAVYVATPAHLHREHVIACAQAGKHVLCEKPLGLSVAEAETMIAACQAANVQLGCALMMRFHSQHQAALRLIQQGKLGSPVYARAQLSCWYPPIPGAWRQNADLGGGGSLMDLGGHCIDLLEMFFGHITRVSCFINNTVHHYGSEDSATAILRFRNGALASVDTFFCIQDASSKNVLELYGSKGSILAQGTIGQGMAGEMVAYLQEEDAAYEARQTRTDGAGLRITPPPRNMYQAEIEEFGESLLEGRDCQIAGSIGLRSQRILSACYESAQSGRAVDLK